MRTVASLVLVFLALAALPLGEEAEARRRRSRRSRFGHLELESKTTGAQVVIDGVEVGKIPFAAAIRLVAGKHTVKITRKGYTQFLDVIEIRRGGVTKLEIDLIPMAGVLTVSANVPKARVYVDGTFVGIAPVEAEALVGGRSVRVSKAGYHDFIARVKAVGGRKLTIKARLEQVPVGSSPYRPAPPPPPKWYEKWYIWAGAAAGVMAVATAIIVPVVISQQDPVEGFGAEISLKAGP